MAIFKHHAPSTTSFSDDDGDDDHVKKSAFYADQDNRNLVVSGPAQWSSKARTTVRIKGQSSSHIRHSPISLLPPELLINVFKHLHSARDLYSSLRVCRAWCECSVELLWHRPAFPKFSTLERVVRILASPDQTFTYAGFIRRVNFLPLSQDVKDEIVSVFSGCQRLERLTMVNCAEVTKDTLIHIFPNFPNLVACDLSGVVYTSDEAVINLARSAKRLQGINLAGCKDVSDEGMMALAENCPLLRRVKLSGLEKLTDTPVSTLAKCCPLLLEIDLNSCQLITDLAIRDVWIYSTHMREMRLSHCPCLTDAAFPVPARKIPASAFPSATADPDELPPLVLSRTFEHLRMLDLTACALVTDDAIEGIISHAPKVRNLVLSKCVLLTDKSVELICRLGRHLHYLHLGHAAKITDRSVRALARSCTRLRYIDFANCTLLTDMSVFELSALPKLRRVGLVRVNNLTDEAIYALAERHATLERIHLSYCDQISVMAIHFLLQKLHKLTHLSLTGVPAFRQPELQQFCREPPAEFSSTQQLAFCVYSGKGVTQLRSYLTELFDRITSQDGTDDTEYEDEDYDPEAFNEDDMLESEERARDYDGLDIHLPSITYGTNPAVYLSRPQDFIMRDRSARASIFPPLAATHGQSTADNLQGAADRLNAQIMAPNAAGNSARRARAPNTARSLADILPIVENSRSPPPSDAASNRSGGTTRSNGATFFRTYHDGVPARSTGALTPDLNFAEIGHGRGAQAGSSGLNQYHLRRGQEFVPHHRPAPLDSEGVTFPPPEPSSSSQPYTANTNDSGLLSTDTHRLYLNTVSSSWAEPNPSVAWPYREPLSPTSPTLPVSPQSTIHGGGSGDGRGRSVKRSLRNTLNVAEQYATTFLFGRAPTRPSHDAGAGPSHTSGPAHHGH